MKNVFTKALVLVAVTLTAQSLLAGVTDIGSAGNHVTRELQHKPDMKKIYHFDQFDAKNISGAERSMGDLMLITTYAENNKENTKNLGIEKALDQAFQQYLILPNRMSYGFGDESNSKLFLIGNEREKASILDAQISLTQDNAGEDNDQYRLVVTIQMDQVSLGSTRRKVKTVVAYYQGVEIQKNIQIETQESVIDTSK